MAQIKERRRHHRIDVNLPITVAYQQKIISSNTKNISILGTYIESNQEITRGMSLDICLTLPKEDLKRRKSKQINCQGIVFRTQPLTSAGPKSRYGIGIFFRSFLKKGEKELLRYINYALEQERKIGKIIIKKRNKRKLLKQKGGK
ncbi:MAG: PilZ domain-containing protein [Candidatus Omnitrophica bacterium]|nr:PilZ domain-containing protein [Candidatus Omnitrophota bacterium]